MFEFRLCGCKRRVSAKPVRSGLGVKGVRGRGRFRVYTTEIGILSNGLP